MTTNSVHSHSQRDHMHLDRSLSHPQTTDDVRERDTWVEGFRHNEGMKLFDCLKFVLVHGMLDLNESDAHYYLIELCKSLFVDNFIDDECLLLQKIANQFVLNFKVWVEDHRGYHAYSMAPLTEKNLEQPRSVYMVFHKTDLIWHPLYVLDSNEVVHTAFAHDDQYIHCLHKNFHQMVVRWNASDKSHQRAMQPQHQESTHSEQPVDVEMIDQTSIPCVYKYVTHVNSDFQPNHNVGDQSTRVSVSVDDLCEKSKTVNDNIQQTTLRNNLILLGSSASSRFPPTTTGVAQTTLDGAIELPAPKLLYQPKCAWHHRFLRDGIKQPLPVFERLTFNISAVPPTLRDVLYIGVGVDTYDDNKHIQKLVVPSGTKVDQNFEMISERSECFKLDPNNRDEYDKNEKCVLSQLSSTDKKEIEISLVKERQSQKITKKLMENGKLKWFKLSSAYYKKMTSNDFQRVSPVSYSSLILESGKSQSVDNPELAVRSLCEKGGQVVPVVIEEPPFGNNVTSLEDLRSLFESQHLNVCMNGQHLETDQFSVEEKGVSFVSPAGMVGHDLYVTINRPADGHVLQHWRMTYQTHGEHDEPCDAYKL